VSQTAAPVFGGHFVLIKVMLDWAAEQNVPALLINSGIYLQMADWELKRVRWLSHGSLCYFIRYNHDGNAARIASPMASTPSSSTGVTSLGSRILL
jgi:hypothetical protein